MRNGNGMAGARACREKHKLGRGHLLSCFGLLGFCWFSRVGLWEDGMEILFFIVGSLMIFVDVDSW